MTISDRVVADSVCARSGYNSNTALQTYTRSRAEKGDDETSLVSIWDFFYKVSQLAGDEDHRMNNLSFPTRYTRCLVGEKPSEI